jgi:hypothetical protein
MCSYILVVPSIYTSQLIYLHFAFQSVQRVDTGLAAIKYVLIANQK